MPLVEARGLVKDFAVRRGLLRRSTATLRAVDHVDLSVDKGECVALVGESGSGKTTLARCMIRLIEPSAGSVLFRGENLFTLSAGDLRRHRRDFQIVFQDPYSSLDPRMKVGRTIAEPLEVHRLVPKAARADRVRELLDMVGLPASAADRYPHEFSGGQRQRIGIARALATEPALLIADEPVSALDVSVQAQIINLLMELRDRLGLTLLVIAHDLGVVRRMADRVAVMYLGRLVEEAPNDRLFAAPQHPYTMSLLSAVPGGRRPGQRARRIILRGELPSPSHPPTGCGFHPRCPIARPHCAAEQPRLEAITGERGNGGAGAHTAACFHPGEPIGNGSAE